MPNRIVVLNPIEPSLLSWRQPLGVDVDLSIEFRDTDDAQVDPASVLPQLVLLPRSKGGRYGYDMEPQTNTARLNIPGTAMTDINGYSVELYSCSESGKPFSLIAQGSVAMQGEAYTQLGPLGMISAPTGPMGPQGEQGKQGTRGSIWFSGVGPPSPDLPAQSYDMYLQTETGDVWQYWGDPLTWTLK